MTAHNTFSFLNECYLSKKEEGVVFPWWLEGMIYINDRFLCVKDEYYPGCLPRKLRKFLTGGIKRLDDLIQPQDFVDFESEMYFDEDFEEE